jgi:hypothetical protein
MTCPKCGTLANRVVGAGLAYRMLECSLCETLYREQLSPDGNVLVTCMPSYYSLQPEPLPPRSLVARVRGALRGAVAGWRGDV